MDANPMSRRQLLTHAFPQQVVKAPVTITENPIQSLVSHLIVQTTHFNAVMRACGLFEINVADPRLNISEWNPEDREPFHRQLAAAWATHARVTTSPTWWGHLRAFSWPHQSDARPKRGETVAFLVSGCWHLDRAVYAGLRALECQDAAVVVHHFLSGRSPMAEMAATSTAFCNTEADHMRETVQRIGLDPMCLHILATATNTNGNIGEWVRGLQTLLPRWERAVVVTDSYHALRCFFGTQLALAEVFGPRPVELLVTPQSHIDSHTGTQERYFQYHIEGFLSALYDWTSHTNAGSPKRWLKERGIIN